MEWIALLVVFGLALAAAFAIGYRSKARSEYMKAREEVAALRSQLSQLQAEKSALDSERLSIALQRRAIEDERARLLDRFGPNAEVSGCLRAPMPEDAQRTAAGSPLDVRGKLRPPAGVSLGE